jgi:hypothetical protein
MTFVPTTFDPADPPSEEQVNAMSLDQRLSLFNELREFTTTRPVDEIPEAVGSLGVLLTRKMRVTTELTGRKPARAKKADTPAASDADLF